MTHKCSTNISPNVATYYNMTHKCSTNSIPNVVTYYNMTHKCSTNIILNVVIYYNMTNKCSTNIIRNVVTYYNMTRKCSTNSIPNVVTYYNMTHKCSTNIIPNVVSNLIQYDAKIFDKQYPLFCSLISRTWINDISCNTYGSCKAISRVLLGCNGLTLKWILTLINWLTSSKLRQNCHD